MVNKRPFHDEECYEVGIKHPRHQGGTAQQSPTMGIDHWVGDPQELFSDEGDNSARKSEDEGKIAMEIAHEDQNGTSKELEINACGSISSCLSLNGNAIDEYAQQQDAVHLSFFPHYFELDHRVPAFSHPRDIYSVLLDHPPRKLVAIGPDHQADIPKLAPEGFKKSSSCLDESDACVAFAPSSESCLVDDDDDDHGAKLMGTCVIPLPDMEASAYSCCMDCGARSCCNCLDNSSVRCVREHVMDAREDLRQNLGQKIFEELGFCDMGEEVAKKWRAEEGEIFDEVVLTNAASGGRNFWDHLSATFPSRTKKDLVSYYFNVFMLRKRAEQNRFDPLNVDSDDDEWQISHVGMTEGDDDSVVESLDQDASADNEGNHDEELVEGNENEGEEDGLDYFVDGVLMSGAEYEDLDNFFPAFRHSAENRKISSCNGEDHDVQDDSCTSYEFQSDKVDSCGLIDVRTDGSLDKNGR